MKILTRNIKSSFLIKKSKFLTFGFLVNTKEEVKTIINNLKKDYPDASHICYAYILDDKSFYFTDGGEPSGTAGKPIYNVLKNAGINYCLFVVIRYFGGIKFGPGPLKTTFRDVTASTLKNVPLKDCIVADIVKIEVPYSKIKSITRTLNRSIINKTFNKEFVTLTLAGNKDTIIHALNILGIEPKSIKENQVI